MSGAERVQRNDTVSSPAAIARAFVTARRNGVGIASYPGRMPADLASAYAVQDAALALADDRVAGWKVGRITPPIDGIDRLSGPIFADRVVVARDAPATMPVFADGFAAAEAEFLLRIGTAPEPDRTDYDRAGAATLVDRVCVGIEIASSPFPGINSHGALVTISDFGNNHGLVVGATLPDWTPDRMIGCPVTLDINGERVGAGTAATMLDGPLGAAAFLVNHLAARGIALTPGQWISSGAVTGVHPVRVGDRVRARFGTDHGVECTIAAH